MLAHVPIALGIQIICWLIGRSFRVPTHASLWIGAFAGSAVCVMREITQREYQWIEAFGHGRRAFMPSYAGLQVWEWNQHSLEETAAAIFAVVILAAAVQLRR